MLPADDHLTAQLAAEQTRRQQAEAALAAAHARIAELQQQLAATTHTAQHQHQQLNTLMQNLGLGLLLLDQESRIQFVNQSFKDLFGLEAHLSLVQEHAPTILPKLVDHALFQDHGAFAARMANLRDTGQTTFEEAFFLSDGRVIEVDHVALGPAQAGRLLCYRDVTARHEHDAQLRTMAFILEQHPHPIVRLTATGDVLYANPAAAGLVQALAATSKPNAMLAQLTAVVQTVLDTAGPHQQELAVAGCYYMLTAVAMPHEAYATLYFTDITARRQAEQELRQQRTFYETILEQVPAGIAVFDLEHRYLFVNPMLEPDAEIRTWLIGKNNFEACQLRNRPLAMAEQRQAHFLQVVQERREVTWEETITQPGQATRHLLRCFRPLFAQDGKVSLIISSGLDITDRKQAETRLTEQQLFVQQVVDTIPSLLCVLNSAEDLSFTNAAFREVFHNTDNTPDQIFMRTAQYQQFAAWNREVLKSGAVIRAEWPNILPSGEVQYFQMDKRPLRQPDGTLAVLSLHTDITELKRLRQQTERREKQYYDLVYYSQALICTHDPQGNILSVNPAIEKLLGRPASFIVGRNIREAMPPEHHAALQAYLAGAPQPQPSVMTISTATGERRYLHYYTYQVEEEGSAPYVVASGYDITQGFQAERALQKAKREAEENARAKEAFLARMSHEMRTPLNGVLGLAALLAKTPLLPTQQEYLTAMAQAGQHLLALINDVLDMAKITTQHVQLEQAAFSPLVVLQGAIQTVATLAEHKGLHLTTACALDGLPNVLGDAYRLRQVLLNLLSNAIKFTERGSVQLGTEVLQKTPEALTLRFWVQDTGIGIASEQQESIFDAFAQASGEVSSRFGGTGLGLTISQQLVQHMGGTLVLCSTPHAGSTFSFCLTLPWAEMPAAADAPLPATEPVGYEDLHGLRVLLAEDNLVNQWIATVMLEHWGVQVQAVGTGTDALAELQTHDYDAAILDIQMPGLSGVEVAIAIRQHAEAARASIPLIALTANAFETDRANYLAAGMNACLTKPFEEASLCDLLLQLTAAKRTAD